MDKKNVDTPLAKPSFFEVFKAECGESDLGPISINWFEELSSEAPFCDFENSEDIEHTTSYVNQNTQNTFETPKRKLPTNSQLASTPMIFKEQNESLPQCASPLKDVSQSEGEAGRCHHPVDSLDTTLDQSDVVVISPFHTRLLASPPDLRKKCKTPPSNKCVLSESLLRTPKLFEAQTQKCISESLGAETDPEMSWSSSLATPPTLSPTVIIARGNDTVSGTKLHDERITLIMHSLFAKYRRSPAKNTVSVQSTSGREESCTKHDSKIPIYEKPIDGSIDVSRFPSKSSVNQKPPEEEDMQKTGTNSGISVCLASGKAFLRKVKTVKPSQKKIFDEVEHDELKETEEANKDSEEFSIKKYERELNNCKCILRRPIVHNNRMQTFRENQNDVHIEKEMPPSLVSPWSQLDLSGLEITQLEKTSSCCRGGSSTLHIEKCSEDRASPINKVCAPTSPLESCIINTSSFIKTYNLINSEKLLAPENSPVPVAVMKKSSTPVNVYQDEQAFVENVSDTGSFLIENTTSTDASETHSNCFHKYSKENCKISSALPLENTLTPVATYNGDLTRSALPTRNSLSNLKRRPKKFIYTINNTPLHQEEGTTQRDGSSTFHVSPCTDFKSCIAEVSKTSRIEGKTKDTLSSNKHIIGEKQELQPEDTDLSVFLQTGKEEAVVFSNLKATNQEKEPCEQKCFAMNNKDILGKDSGGKCVHPANFSSLPDASQLKMGNDQEVLELTTQHSSPSDYLMGEPEYLTKKIPATRVLKKNEDLRQPEPLDLKENVEDNKPRWLGSGHGSSVKTPIFDGFKTASDKQIVVSNNNIRKGKLLFKDIEDQFLEDFPTKRIQNISNLSNQNVRENAENSSVVRNNLNRKKSSNFSHVSDFQVNFNKCSDAHNIFPEYANIFFQNVPKNLTASQEAEVTELSNILEETGSQFEFTQFKEQRTMLYNNNLEVSGSINKNKINTFGLNSEVWKDVDFDKCSRTKVKQGNYLSPSRQIGATEESKAQRQSWEEVPSINTLTASSILAPLQPRLFDLGECSVLNTEVSLSDEVTSKAPKAVSRMGEKLDLHKTYFQSGLSERSNNYCRNNPKYMKRIDGHQRVKEVNAENTLKNNANNTITFVKENTSKDTKFENNVVHISSTTEVNLKIVQKYSLHMTGNQLSSIENNCGILVSRRFVNCGETQCKYNLQETLSDLTCLAEITKNEKNSFLNDADEKENNSNQDQEKMNNSGSGHSLHSVRSGADGDIFAEKTETRHLFAGSSLMEELGNMSSYSSKKAGVNSWKGAITSLKKSIDLNENEINYQEAPDTEKRKQNCSVGFYTASGKPITICDESLAKARRFLSEQNIFPETEDAFRNLAKPGIQASTKENKDENITRVRDKFGEGTEKHWGKVQNSQSVFEDSLQTVNPESIQDNSLETNESGSDLVSHNGRGKECNMNEGLLAKNNLTSKLSKNEGSKMVFIDSGKEEQFCVEAEPDIYEKQDVHNLSIGNTRNISHDPCNEKSSISNKLIYISQEALSDRCNVEKNLSSFENVPKNDSQEMQKCDTKSFDSNTLPENSPGLTEALTSKLLKARPIAFTTASGKTVGVSQDALTKTRGLFRSNCFKPIKQNTEYQSETRMHDTLNSCLDVVNNDKCAVSTNCSNAENTAIENSVASQFSRMREYCYEDDEQALQFTDSLSLDLDQDSTSCFHMKAEHSDALISNKRNGISADFSTAKGGFFSTASGKPVKISEESLKKSRLLFSEIENNSSEYQSSVPDCNFACDGSSVRDKTASQKNKQLPSKEKTSVNFEVNSNISCGFSTASGKQMQISEKAFKKAMGLIKEFDEISSNCSSVDKQCLMQGYISPLKPSATEAEDEIISESKPKDKCNAVYLTSNCDEKDLVSIKVPVCVSHAEECKQAVELEESSPCGKKIEPLETNSSTERKHSAKCNTITKGKLIFHFPTYSQIRDNYLETEASESAKAFMQDDDLTDTEVLIQKNKKSSLVCRKSSNFQLTTRTGKRQMEEHHTFGEPPIKRKLLPQFDQSERSNNTSFKVLKSTPDGTMNDRIKFTYDISLKPVICDPFRKPSTEESKKKENHNTAKRPVQVFVPPFKTRSGVSEDKMGNNKESGLLASKSIDKKGELNPATFPTTITELENELFEEDTATHISVVDSKCKDEDLTNIIANLHHARNLQEIRILKKQRQKICPQPGSLYLMKMAADACRIPLKNAVEEKSPGSYTSEQLYSLGVSKQCMKVNSRNAEDFQFLIQEFFSREYFLERHGIQLADGGYLIPTNEGKAGKEEFYQALCDTPGVDPKLISKAWVYNHYRWIVWKHAAMEVAFPQEFANKCLTPERVLLQLKYRYDVEIDRSHRSAIKRITERDDVAAKTLILCISKIISLNTNMSHVCDNKNAEESKKKVAVVEVTDGWYGIRAILDIPLQSLLCKDMLAVGQKIIVHGAELMGSQDASTPLEAPESLMLKISANSTRRTRWYSKLGYCWDPRPFCVPLSSLFSDGGTVSCIDVIVQRIYPIQWMEKVSVGSYVFRNCRAEEREAAKHAENRQKMFEALLAKIQAEFEKSEGEGKRVVRFRTLTRQQIRSLQDGAELYEAILNAADPAYMEGYFSEEQLKALNSHRQMVNAKRQAQIEAEFRKAVESAEQDEHTSCKRDVIPVMKLRITDYRIEGRRKEVILNIWRPSSHVCTLLNEGGRYRIFHLTASQSKDRAETANLQLTATKKTQYLQLPVSQEVLSHVYKPRQTLQFNRLLEPSFQPTCSEVDLVGYIVCLGKGAGFSTLLHLSDENHNLIAVQISSDLKLLAIEDIVIPSAVISATNLQWRAEFRSPLPTLFAGDRSAFSSSPKESHLQGTFNELRNVVENNSVFGEEVQQRLMELLPDRPQVFNLPKECSLDSFPSHWKPGAGNKLSISTCSSELKHPSPLSLGKLDPKLLVSLGPSKCIQEVQETPKNYKKRKAMELLSQVPSPPPVKPICTLVSPSVKRAFQPPRSSAAQQERPLERRYCQSVKKPALKTARETGFLIENNFVADEELAMINTQALLTNFPEDKECGSADQTAYTGCSDLPDRPLLRNDSP